MNDETSVPVTVDRDVFEAELGRLRIGQWSRLEAGRSDDLTTE